MSTTTAKTSDLLAAGTTTVRSIPSRLNSVVLVSDGTNAATLTIYDNTAGSGIVLYKAFANATCPTIVATFAFPVRAETGVTVVLSGTGSGAILSLDA